MSSIAQLNLPKLIFRALVPSHVFSPCPVLPQEVRMAPGEIQEPL